MLRSVRSSLFSSIASGFCAVALAQTTTAPVTPPPQAGAPSGLPAAGRAPLISGASEVVATVTLGSYTDKITKGEVYTFLSRYPPPRPEDRETVYRESIDHLVNTKLLTQFLARQKIPVPPEKVEEEIERIKQQLKGEGQDLNAAVSQSGLSLEEIKKTYEERIRWSEFVWAKATDAALRKYLADNRDLFSGTQVRASHIMLRADPSASDAERQKLKAKLASIKSEINQRKLTFAEAANKYSEDPANAGGAGGDLDYFSLNTGYVEEFTNAAFKLRKGMISDVVETPFGYHLIQVTDRKDGKPVDFEQNRPYILNAYGGELQKNIVTAERKNAKIKVEPAPKDLFPSEPTPLPGQVDASAPNTTVDGAVPK
jgi:parvulin-like peptidyl-prolyl isomerase